MGDCPCNTELIMAEAKTKKAESGITKPLHDVLKQMVSEAETQSDSVIKNEERRQCIAKLDTVIKFIEARW